jgi:hypothetical protein
VTRNIPTEWKSRTIPDTYKVEKIDHHQGTKFIKEHHYSRGSHKNPTCWGLFDDEELIGVIAFAAPASENLRYSVFGKEHAKTVTELHRLVLLDRVPPNTESWFIVRGLKALKEAQPHLKAVISFADPTVGHAGTIYKATNAIYTGTTGKRTFYVDEIGRLRAPRHCGVNILRPHADALGWVTAKRDAKHRYIFLLGDKNEKKWSRKHLKLPVLDEYPKSMDLKEKDNLRGVSAREIFDVGSLLYDIAALEKFSKTVDLPVPGDKYRSKGFRANGLFLARRKELLEQLDRLTMLC